MIPILWLEKPRLGEANSPAEMAQLVGGRAEPVRAPISMPNRYVKKGQMNRDMRTGGEEPANLFGTFL